MCTMCTTTDVYLWGIASSGKCHFEGLPSCYTLLSLSLAGWKACGIIEDDDLVAHGAGKFEQEFTISLRELQDSWEFCSWAVLQTMWITKTRENVIAGEMHTFLLSGSLTSRRNSWEITYIYYILMRLKLVSHI